MSTTPEPDPVTRGQGLPARRLTRLQQLTLNVWRHAAASVARRVPPEDVLAHVAIQAVLAVVRDTADPIDLFTRHHMARMNTASSSASPASARAMTC